MSTGSLLTSCTPLSVMVSNFATARLVGCNQCFGFDCMFSSLESSNLFWVPSATLRGEHCPPAQSITNRNRIFNQDDVEGMSKLRQKTLTPAPPLESGDQGPRDFSLHVFLLRKRPLATHPMERMEGRICEK